MSSQTANESETGLIKPESDASQDVSFEDQVILLVAGLMEGGKDDDETCRDLDQLTRFLSNETPKKDGARLAHEYVDMDGFETIMGYLDMRQHPIVRGHATLTVSAYLKVAGEEGVDFLAEFFKNKVGKGTYDDYILAFSVAASIFPIVPATCAQLFLSDGFIRSLGPLMKRKWKSRKVEQACLEMINAACMNSACRESVRKQCTEWLEEIVNTEPRLFGEVDASGTSTMLEDGPTQHRIHSENVINLAAVILAKLQAVPVPATTPTGERIRPVSTSIEILSQRFISMMESPEENSRKAAIEGMAYSSLQSHVREQLITDTNLLENLRKELRESSQKPDIAYGILTIISNLTSFQPVLSEEQKNMAQLAAYANAANKAHEPDPLNDDEHVLKRCQKIFNSGLVPAMIFHSKHATPASLNLTVTIFLSLARLKTIRPQLVQLGAVKFLLGAYDTFPATSIQGRRAAAHALARCLISVDPSLVFGGSRTPMESALPPLYAILDDDPTTEQRDRLPVFESLLALTNLASTETTIRDTIVRSNFDKIESLLFTNNVLITRAVLELINNLSHGMDCLAKYLSNDEQSRTRLRFLLGYADSEDEATRSAAGGALASLTQYAEATNFILDEPRGVAKFVNLCKEDREGLRHRGVVSLVNMFDSAPSSADRIKAAIRGEEGVEALQRCLQKSRDETVIQLTLEVLKKICIDHELDTVTESALSNNRPGWRV